MTPLLAVLQATSESSAPSTADALATLLAAEGLVLVAVSVAVTLAAGSEMGTDWLVSPGCLAAISTVILIALAAGAGFAWADVWAGGNWPSYVSGIAAAVALAIGIVAPPTLSLLVTINVWD